MAEERLQKILARAGIASRRAAERMIEDGRVSVNGSVVTRLGTHADADEDHIRVDGKLLGRSSAPPTYYAAFKPREMISTLADPEGRPTLTDLLRRARVRARVFPVGRLDWDSDGLMLLTNDGELAARVTHPKWHLPKVYRVKVRGHPDEPTLRKLRNGVFLEKGVKTAPAEVRVERELELSTWLQITLHEGRKNQIKRMLERVGHPVRRLRRTAIGPIRLGKMRVGEVRALAPTELERLRRAVQLEGSSRPGRPPASRGRSGGKKVRRA